MLENSHRNRLEALGREDIKNIEAPHDFRNYIVKSSEEIEVGRVSDLLYDIKSRKVRYLVITLDKTMNSRRILAPIGMIDFYQSGGWVLIPTLISELIDALPDYIEGDVNPGVENMVRLAYAEYSDEADCAGLTGNDVLTEDDSFYSHFHFSLNKIFSSSKEKSQNKTVSGIFDDSLEAENSISELLSNGFSQDTIELSSTNNRNKREELESDSEPGSVVSVKITTEKEALRVSEILDRNGSISVYENS